MATEKTWAEARADESRVLQFPRKVWEAYGPDEGGDIQLEGFLVTSAKSINVVIAFVPVCEWPPQHADFTEEDVMSRWIARHYKFGLKTAQLIARSDRYIEHAFRAYDLRVDSNRKDLSQLFLAEVGAGASSADRICRPGLCSQPWPPAIPAWVTMFKAGIELIGESLRATPENSGERIASDVLGLQDRLHDYLRYMRRNIRRAASACEREAIEQGRK